MLECPSPSRVVVFRQAQTSSLFDVEIQLETQVTRHAPSGVLLRTVDENLFDVLIEVKYIVDVPIQLQTFGVLIKYVHNLEA
ncbi:hypothetical protein MKW92_046749, partial [Papaver armeniacum]